MCPFDKQLFTDYPRFPDLESIFIEPNRVNSCSCVANVREWTPFHPELLLASKFSAQKTWERWELRAFEPTTEPLGNHHLSECS